MMTVLVNNLHGHIPCPGRDVQYPAFEPFQFLNCHSPPIEIPSQTEKMVEKVVGGSNVVKEVSNRIRMETVGFHLAEKGCLLYPVRNNVPLLCSPACGGITLLE
jgi:hypothetical protein